MDVEYADAGILMSVALHLRVYCSTMINRALHPLVASILVASIAFGATPSQAGGEENVPIRDAEVIIKECWDLSEEMRSSGVTNKMRKGHLETALCLEEAIIDNASTFIYPGYMSREEIVEKMRQTRFAVGGLYWALYNEHEKCPRPSCGTLYNTYHNTSLAHLYEEILRRVISHRKSYDK